MLQLHSLGRKILYTKMKKCTVYILYHVRMWVLYEREFGWVKTAVCHMLQGTSKNCFNFKQGKISFDRTFVISNTRGVTLKSSALTIAKTVSLWVQMDQVLHSQLEERHKHDYYTWLPWTTPRCLINFLGFVNLRTR